jgi:LacI family transcriptional regulator
VLLVGDPGSGIDAVSMDEQRGAYKAVSHLIATGHSKIALIDGAVILGNTEKQTGYLQAHAEAGLTADPQLFIDPKGHSVEYGYWAMAALMQRLDKPSAVFATNDSLAFGVLRYCSKHGIKVPNEI